MSAMTSFRPPVGGALIASPSRVVREQVERRIASRWTSVKQVESGADALAKLEEGDWQILFLDRRLPDLDCDELVDMVRRRFPAIQVEVVDSDTPLPESETAAREQTHTALLPAAAQLRETRSWAVAQSIRLSEAGNEPDRENATGRYAALPGMIGGSEAMQQVYRLAKLVAPRTTTVLIVGPTGTGKELVARALHALSPRAMKPFIAVNCAAIPETLLESELFGHARGAFTGAVQAQIGRIPAAHGGTLFLDEVGELPLSMQAKLLRFLEEKEVQRLGSADLTRVDVRVVAASNVDIAGRAGRGEFREDLFYRLSAFPLELPPLSERRADIIPLAEHFLACMAAAMSAPCPQISAEAGRVLEAHPWRGNVRELQHVMERASILVEDRDTVLSEHLYFPFQSPVSALDNRSRSCAGRAS
ncbi:MAG TPA: sigma-54 dependent transcriptional regulator [Candidatus Aquilonibacter sp.]|nr:sigma-54 dependent transcriptional regulator [Candidatus Aquilonibacter sp.]